MRLPARAVTFAVAGLLVVACGPGGNAGSGGDTDGSTSGTTGGATDSTDTGSTTGGGPDLDAFFDPNVVHTFELDIAPADRQAMFDALPDMIYVPATFHWQDVTIDTVAVRFKGNSSSDPNQQHKRSYLIKFNEYVPGQRFQDLRRLSLDNGVQFGSLFSERLITDTLRAHGAMASRTNYCRLVVNGEYQGVYVNVERMDKSFLKHHFADPDGPLYKVHEGGPGAVLEFLGDDPALYGTAFENKGDAVWDGNFQPLVDLTKSLDQVGPGQMPAWLAAHWDTTSFDEDLPVLLLSGAFDQYTGWNAHNYYLYWEPTADRWTYLPWDLDVGFADNAFGVIPVLDGWNAAYPWPVSPRPLLERIVSDDGLKQAYRDHAATVLEADFHPDVIIPRLLALYDLIEPHLADDPFPDVRATNPEDTGYDSILASLSAFMEARYAAAVGELANPVDTPPADQGDVPPPGPPSPADPSNLMVVSVTANGVELSWTDNSSNEGAFVLQRCSGSGCIDFAPHIGVDPNVTTVVDPAVASGQTFTYRVYAIIPAMPPQATGASNVVEATIP